MARTPLLSHLGRAFAKALFARKHGLSEPAEIDAAWQARRLERRKILQWSAGVVAASTLPGTAGCEDGPIVPEPPEPEIQIVVVGAGMAGLHCAYRLLQAGANVTVHEAADRVGGRMFSARDIGPDNQLCELGGELIDTNHLTLHALAEELGLALDDRWADEPAGFKREINYIAGAEVPLSTIVEQYIPVAAVMQEQLAMTEEDDAYFEELDNTTLQDWLDTYCPKDTYLELHEILRVAYRGEYGAETTEQSCLNLLYFIDSENPEDFAIFGESDERWHTHEGNDSFPTKLREGFEGLGGVIQVQSRLVAARDGADGKTDLDFQQADGSVVTVTADHVVFALPYTLLREVDLTGLTLSEEKRKIITELGYGTNAKVMTVYSSRVWRTDHNAGGAVTTDLAIQQTWESTIGQEGAAGILTNFLGGDGGLHSDEGTPEEYHQKVLPDLEQIWPGTEAAYVADSAVRMHWPTYELTKGSYTSYLPGQWSFYGLEGAREGNLHFIGEHTSLDFQGFMEGAAESGALAAMAIIDELGLTASPQHAAIVDAKLVVPQPWYGGPSGPIRLPERRRLRRERMRG